MDTGLDAGFPQPVDEKFPICPFGEQDWEDMVGGLDRRVSCL